MLIRVGSIRASVPFFVAIAVALPRGFGADGNVSSDSVVFHQEIDSAVGSVHVGPHSAISSDEEFCRRIHLDLIGRIPTREEVTEFTIDANGKKRSSLIDRLLRSDACDDFLAETFDILLMERRKDQHVTTAEWRAFLKDSFAANKSYQQLAREILSSDGSDAKIRPAAKFYLDRQMESHAVTQDVSRMFLGRNIECAQCHDHPLYGDYLQSEYYGIFSLVSRSYLFTDDKSKKSLLGEKADGEAEYSSVFEPDVGKVVALPQVVGGLALDREPLFQGDDAYQVKPAKGVRSVPTFSRRESLARFVTDRSNLAFRLNIANRLWAHMMGRGLVDPIDLHQSDNQPTNAELLKLLADEFLRMNFDTKEMIRQIALSKSYQRTIDVPAPILDIAALRSQLTEFGVALAKQKRVCDRLSAEVEAASEVLGQRRKSVRANLDETAKLKKQIANLEKNGLEQNKKISQMQKQHDLKKQLADSIDASLTRAKNARKELKNDKSLAKTVKQIESNSKEVSGQVAQLAKRLKQEKEKVAETSNKVATLLTSVRQFESDRGFLTEEVAEYRGVYRFFAKKLEVQTVTLTDIQRRISATQQTLEYVALTEQLQGSSEQLATRTSQLEAATAQVDAERIERSELEQKLIAQQADGKAMSESLSRVKEDAQAGAALIATLEEAVSQTESAIAQLAGDEELDLAVDTIRARLQSARDDQQKLSKQMERWSRQSYSNEKSIKELKRRLAELNTRCQASSKKCEQLSAEVKAKHNEVSATESKRDLAFEQMTEAWTNQFAVRPLAPLQPEQLARSLVVALGLDHRFRQEAESEWSSKNKDKKTEEIDVSKKELDIDALYKKRMKSTEDLFVRLFAAAPGSPQDLFQSSVDQALFLGNDNKVKSWLSPREHSLVKQLREEKDSNQFAKSLYLSVLSRHPSDMETKDVAEYLAARPKERNSAVDELVWGLITSLEFRFNH